ncbi:toll-like receptor 13 [Littorina saxatilis]|uniref:toll-like receptor 13 n=1 Tax=Littorina saxatilis TaxID=31220 RepID=UPI0038B4A844
MAGLKNGHTRKIPLVQKTRVYVGLSAHERRRRRRRTCFHRFRSSLICFSFLFHFSDNAETATALEVSVRDSMARLNGFCVLLAACCYLLVPFLCKPSAAVTRKFFSCEIPGSKGGKPYDCYHGKCWCTKTRANCSHNNGRLLFVPKLPRGIQFLDLSYNNLSNIPEDFFANVTNITSLSLSTNSIANISDGAFRQLKWLEVVVFDNNFYLHNMIKPVFEAKTLKCVDFRHGELYTLPQNIYDSVNLEEMYFHGNYLGDLNLSRFENLPKLRVLDWAGNYAHTLFVGHMENLQNLDLSYNQLTFFPDACRASGSESLLPRLKWLNLKNNAINTILEGAPACMPWLQHLELSGNSFAKLRSNMFHTDRFPFLTNLYLENMQQRLAHVNNFTFNNTHLQTISLMGGRLKFADEDTIQPDSFAGCPGLLSLQLSDNVFSGLSDDRFLRLFGNLTNTDTIYMGSTSFERITPKTFANFPRLKKLYLYMNKINQIPDAAFANNPILQELNMNDNQLTTVKETAFTKANHEKLRFVDLSGNPFFCDCDLRWFSDWLRSNKTLFKHSRSSYTCSNLHQEVASFSMPDQACLLSPATSEFIVVSFSILLVTMTAVSAVFRYRWHLRLVLYEVFRGRNDNRRRRLEEGNFDYDVFVSYASEDLPWVREHLMPELEDRLGLRLCVHERDFIPGKNIVENIADCVESSKKILMVFSNDFVRSQWCQFELAFCLRHAMDTDDVLVVVCVDDVASRDLTSSMMAVMKTTTYIQWVEDRDAMASFWGRMRMAFEEIVLDGHQQRDLA